MECVWPMLARARPVLVSDLAGAGPEPAPGRYPAPGSPYMAHHDGWAMQGDTVHSA